MARSYTRSKGRNKNGLLVREKPVTMAMSSNSLYCQPVKEAINNAAAAGTVVLQTTSTAHQVQFGNVSGAATLGKIVRISSMICSSKSPFVVAVANASGGWTRYQIPGQKITKIVFSRESSYPGNPALLNTYYDSTHQIVKCFDGEDGIDITFNCVVDSALDD